MRRGDFQSPVLLSLFCCSGVPRLGNRRMRRGDFQSPVLLSLFCCSGVPRLGNRRMRRGDFQSPVLLSLFCCLGVPRLGNRRMRRGDFQSPVLLSLFCCSGVPRLGNRRPSQKILSSALRACRWSTWWCSVQPSAVYSNWMVMCSMPKSPDAISRSRRRRNSRSLNSGSTRT